MAQKNVRVTVVEFDNEEGLMWLADTIHQQWLDFMDGGEDSGWSGDAGYGPMPVILPRFKSFIAVKGSNMLFGFTSESDNFCVLADYLSDKSLLPEPGSLKKGEYGLARLPRKAGKQP